MEKDERQAKALNILADAFERVISDSPHASAVITPATPAVVEATVMVAATVAGSCAVTDEVRREQEAVVQKLRGITSLEDIRKLRLS